MHGQKDLTYNVLRTPRFELTHLICVIMPTRKSFTRNQSCAKTNESSCYIRLHVFFLPPNQNFHHLLSAFKSSSKFSELFISQVPEKSGILRSMFGCGKFADECGSTVRSTSGPCAAACARLCVKSFTCPVWSGGVRGPTLCVQLLVAFCWDEWMTVRALFSSMCRCTL